MHNQKRKSFSLLHHCTKNFAIDIINGDFQNKKSTGVQYPTPKREPFTLPARHLHNQRERIKKERKQKKTLHGALLLYNIVVYPFCLYQFLQEQRVERKSLNEKFFFFIILPYCLDFFFCYFIIVDIFQLNGYFFFELRLVVESKLKKVAYSRYSFLLKIKLQLEK